MLGSLSNSIDIIANSVSPFYEDKFDNIVDLFLKKTAAIQHLEGIPPVTLNHIQTLAESINNDGSFYNTINKISTLIPLVWRKAKVYLTKFQFSSMP